MEGRFLRADRGLKALPLQQKKHPIPFGNRMLFYFSCVGSCLALCLKAKTKTKDGRILHVTAGTCARPNADRRLRLDRYHLSVRMGDLSEWEACLTRSLNGSHLLVHLIQDIHQTVEGVHVRGKGAHQGENIGPGGSIDNAGVVCRPPFAVRVPACF